MTPMVLGEGEPVAGPLRVVPIKRFAEAVLDAAAANASPGGRTRIVAIDGRSASGKTSLSRRLAAAIPGSCVVHTDDIAWWHSFFGWADLLRSGVLQPVRRGEAVSYRPPAWDERQRVGSVDVPAGTSVLIVEGVGAARRELAPEYDAIVYMQVDLIEMERRDAARIAAGEADPDVVAAWQPEELTFVAGERPWERADLIACSSSDVAHDPEREVVVAESPLIAP